MGDRANIQVKESFGSEQSNVFLYTHWAGSELPDTLQAALKKRWRWDDGQYLARIIFQEMLADHKGENGFGITSIVGDGDTRILVVDVDKQQVIITTKSYGSDDLAERAFSFEDYIALESLSWYDDDEDED